jgi:hypothetical protein
VQRTACTRDLQLQFFFNQCHHNHAGDGHCHHPNQCPCRDVNCIDPEQPEGSIHLRSSVRNWFLRPSCSRQAQEHITLLCAPLHSCAGRSVDRDYCLFNKHADSKHRFPQDACRDLCGYYHGAAGGKCHRPWVERHYHYGIWESRPDLASIYSQRNGAIKASPSWSEVTLPSSMRD